MAKIQVEIDCGPEHCGPCHGLGWVALAKGGEMTDPVCNIFNLDLGKAENPENAHRCLECMNSEVKAWIVKGKCEACGADIQMEATPMPLEDTCGQDGFYEYDFDCPLCGHNMEGVLKVKPA